MIRYSKFCIAIEFSLIRCTWITWWTGKCWIFMRDWCYLLSRNIWIRANWWMIGCWRDWWFIRFHRNGIFYWIGDGRRIIHWLIWRVRHLRRILTHRIGRMVWHWTCSCWHSLLMWRIGREFSRDKPLFHRIINILNTSKISLSDEEEKWCFTYSIILHWDCCWLLLVLISWIGRRSYSIGLDWSNVTHGSSLLLLLHSPVIHC